MPQFINGKDTIMIDGKGYGVGLVQIKRKADVLDKYAKRTVSGDLRREILGVYFNYELVCNIARRVPRVYYEEGKENICVNYLV